MSDSGEDYSSDSDFGSASSGWSPKASHSMSRPESSAEQSGTVTLTAEQLPKVDADDESEADVETTPVRQVHRPSDSTATPTFEVEASASENQHEEESRAANDAGRPPSVLTSGMNTRPISRELAASRSNITATPSDIQEDNGQMLEKRVHTPAKVPRGGRSVKLPPIPRQGRDMLDELVDKPLTSEETEEFAVRGMNEGGTAHGHGHSHGGAFGGTTSTTTEDPTGYSSLQDPHLKEFWERRRDLKKIITTRKTAGKRRLQALYGKQPNSAEGTMKKRGHRLEPIGQRSASADGGSPIPLNESAQSAEVTSLNLTSTLSGSRSSYGMQRKPRKSEKERLAFPVNTTPFDLNELLCLKTLLTPKPTFQCKVATPHCDLQWLRQLMATHDNDATKAPSGKQMMNLRSFPVDGWAHDETQYNPEDDPFEAKLINSPRSTVVLLRNGVQAYELLERPPKFFSRPGEAMSMSVLEGRKARSMLERGQLLHELQQQYDIVCAAISLPDLITSLTQKSVGRSAEAHAKAKARHDRDVKAITFMEERQQNINQMQMRRREENARKAFELESMLERKKQEKHDLLKSKATEATEKVQSRQRIQEKIQRARAELTAEAQHAMADKRERNRLRVLELKREQQEHAAHKAEENASRVARSKQLLDEWESNHMARMAELEEYKRQRADEFQDRKAEEHAALMARQEVRHDKQEAFKARAEQIHDEMVASVEAKLAAARQRAREFAQQREDERAVQAEKHRARERRIQLAVEQSAAYYAGKAEDITIRREQMEQRMEERKQREAEENLLTKEANTFERQHKHRVVDVQLNQVTYSNLVSVSAMQQRESEITEFEDMKALMKVQMQDSAKELRVRRDELGAKNKAATVGQERRIAKRTYAITNPQPKFKTPTHLRNVAPRTDFGQHRKELTEDEKAVLAERKQKRLEKSTSRRKTSESASGNSSPSASRTSTSSRRKSSAADETSPSKSSREKKKKKDVKAKEEVREREETAAADAAAQVLQNYQRQRMASADVEERRSSRSSSRVASPESSRPETSEDAAAQKLQSYQRQRMASADVEERRSSRSSSLVASANNSRPETSGDTQPAVSPNADVEDDAKKESRIVVSRPEEDTGTQNEDATGASQMLQNYSRRQLALADVKAKRNAKRDARRAMHDRRWSQDVSRSGGSRLSSPTGLRADDVETPSKLKKRVSFIDQLPATSSSSPSKSPIAPAEEKI